MMFVSRDANNGKRGKSLKKRQLPGRSCETILPYVDKAGRVGTDLARNRRQGLLT